MASTNREMNRSATASTTTNRLAAMQDWPLFSTRAVAATLTAWSTSAEDRTRNGSDPPSSSTHFFNARPAASATLRPAASLPVRVTATIRSSAMSPATSPEGMSNVLNAPWGNPARRNTSSIKMADWGTLDACLSKPTLPAMSAGAANRITCHSGKFHGITASTGPSGW